MCLLLFVLLLYYTVFNIGNRMPAGFYRMANAQGQWTSLKVEAIIFGRANFPLFDVYRVRPLDIGTTQHSFFIHSP